MTFNLDGLLTLGEFKRLTAEYADDTLITVCGSESVLLRLEKESRVSPQTLVLDSTDVEADPEEIVLYKTADPEEEEKAERAAELWLMF
jgi:hypothetical protein